jgi:hypothetical protein
MGGISTRLQLHPANFFRFSECAFEKHSTFLASNGTLRPPPMLNGVHIPVLKNPRHLGSFHASFVNDLSDASPSLSVRGPHGSA